VRLHWQQWNLRSHLLDTIAEEIAAEARRVLGAA
jgi:LysR family transcriptional regulator (chromosome initiation inhibitor)